MTDAPTGCCLRRRLGVRIVKDWSGGKLSAFATGHVAFALDGADRTGYGGRAGIRLEW